jgi:hypothetical protein
MFRRRYIACVVKRTPRAHAAGIGSPESNLEPIETMKRIIIAALAATAIVTGAVYAAGFKCAQCNGTGWQGQFKCQACGGDGVFGN